MHNTYSSYAGMYVRMYAPKGEDHCCMVYHCSRGYIIGHFKGMCCKAIYHVTFYPPAVMPGRDMRTALHHKSMKETFLLFPTFRCTVHILSQCLGYQGSVVSLC